MKQNKTAEGTSSLPAYIPRPGDPDPYNCHAAPPEEDGNVFSAKACSATDFTGLIPALPQSESQLESYAQIYGYPADVFQD